MATTREQRPQDLSKQAPTAQIAKKAPDAAGKGPEAAAPGPAAQVEGIEPELAASLQATWGNDLIQSVTTGARAGVDSGDSEEEQSTESELEREAGQGRGNASSASGMGLTGGGGGGEVEAPWSMGRWFGGDDDGGPALPRPLVRWAPSLVPMDPDEAPPVEGGSGGGDWEAPDLGEARAALGEAPVPPGFLGRGLRHSEHLAVVGFGPATLARLGPQAAWSRARSALRFLSERGDGDVPALALLALSGAVAGAADRGGLAGATARALAAVEALLGISGAPSAWEAVVDIAVDPTPRPRVERVAAAIGPDLGFDAAALFEEARAGATGPVWFPDAPHPHPSAEAALIRAAGLADLPEVVFPAVASAPVLGDDPYADVFRAFTQGTDGDASPFGAVYEGWNLLLAALGEVQVEVAAGALAAVGHLSAAQCHEELTRLADAVSRATALAVRAGEEAEASGAHEDHVQACAAFLAAREVADTVRRATLRQLARAIRLPSAPFTTPDPDVLAAAAALARGGVALARPVLERLCVPTADPTAAVARQLARSILAGGALGAERWDEADHHARASLAEMTGRRPYLLAEAALTAAVAVARGGPCDRAVGEPFAILYAAGESLREAGEGGALNLLVAGWAELRDIRPA